MSDKVTFTEAVTTLYGGDGKGVKAQMARDFGVSRQAVNSWRKTDSVPQRVKDALKERAN